MFLSLLLTLVVFHADAKRSKLRECVRPWQSPLMSKATISTPSRPLECHPDAMTCPKGRNEACQFSLRSFKYICCQDNADVDPPVCPKYHDTLLMTCGGKAEGNCPRSYNCLPSRFDESYKLCCRPNNNITYPEPETTFRENKIVPQVLPSPPLTELEITFGNETLIMGQLFNNEELETLSDVPELKIKELKENTLYTVVILDSTSKKPVWLAANIPVRDNKLSIGSGERVLVTYVKPQESDFPSGLHVMVVVVFQQSEPWSNRDFAKVQFDDFSFGSFTENEILDKVPVAASFYGFLTNDDDRD